MDETTKQDNLALAKKLLSEQNFSAAAVAGAAAAAIAAVIYALVVARFSYAHGFAAAGVGVVVGISTQFLGRGIEARFGALAAAYTVLGCLLGNWFASILSIAARYGVSPIEVFRGEYLSELAGWSIRDISLGDLIYWFVAVFCAVFLAKRPLSRAERLAIGLFRTQS